MRVSITGAGNVGRSIARELLANGHHVLLIDRNPKAIKPHSVPGADWLLADACEVESLNEARMDQCDVAISATGDDKANLVHSLLAKTEFSVPRTVARVNEPNNEWMFDEMWGVDVAVSTPRLISAIVEEAVTVGDVVRLFSFHDGRINLVELVLPMSSPAIGKRVSDLALPGGYVLVAIVKDGHASAPSPEDILGGSDELLFVGDPAHEAALADYLAPRAGRKRQRA